MAITRLTGQDATGTSSVSTSVSASYASTPTANNLLIAIVGDNDGNDNATAISGWTKVLPVGNASGTNEVAIFYKVATGAESTTVTATTSAGTTSCMAIYEYSGLVTTSVLDKNTAGGSIGSPQSTGTTATTTVANELIIVAGFTTGAAPTFTSWSNSFNLRNSVVTTTFGLFTGDQIVSATGAYSSSLAVSGGIAFMGTVIATFKGSTVVATGNMLQFF